MLSPRPNAQKIKIFARATQSENLRSRLTVGARLRNGQSRNDGADTVRAVFAIQRAIRAVLICAVLAALLVMGIFLSFLLRSANYGFGPQWD